MLESCKHNAKVLEESGLDDYRGSIAAEKLLSSTTLSSILSADQFLDLR